MALTNLKFDMALAFRALRKNKMRSGITMGIIALGIMALVGILTAIEGLKSSIYANFSGMGANTFQITNEILKKKEHSGGLSISTVDQKNILYDDALEFKNRFRFPATVCISVVGSTTATVKQGSIETNPNITVMGVDENYLSVA